MALNAHRNGYFFVIDRVTGEHLLTTKVSATANWASRLNGRGQPIRDPAKDPHPDGVLVSPTNGGAANWPPPAFNPDTGLFYVPATENMSMYYATEGDPRGNLGLGGKTELAVAGGGSFLKAIDPTTGAVAWQVRYPTGAAPEAGLTARDAATGKPIATIRKQPTNAPQTYMLDGKQYLLFGSGPNLHAYTLP